VLKYASCALDFSPFIIYDIFICQFKFGEEENKILPTFILYSLFAFYLKELVVMTNKEYKSTFIQTALFATIS